MGFGKDSAKVWRYVSLISQVSISMLTPVFMMILFCTWLKDKYGLGNWVIIAGLLLGVGSGFSSIWTYVKRFLREGEKQQQDYDNQFK